MLIIPPPKPLKKQPKIRPPAVVPAPPVAALTLIAASYNSSTLTLLLTFDRAIDISGFAGGEVSVLDGTVNHHEYAATGTATVSGALLSVLLVAGLGEFGPAQTLTASDATGIKAAGDGGLWAGVSDLVLPLNQ